MRMHVYLEQPIWYGTTWWRGVFSRGHPCPITSGQAPAAPKCFGTPTFTHIARETATKFGLLTYFAR